MRPWGAAVQTAAALVIACASDPAEPSPEDRRAAQLLEDVESADWRSWAHPPSSDDGNGPQPARGPHGAFVWVYLSPGLQAAAAADQTLERWPTASLVVAEGYEDAQGEPQLLMIARRDEDAWTWAQLLVDGTPLTSGRPTACVGCHASGQDQLFSVSLPVAED